jgi:hypothetical protein
MPDEHVDHDWLDDEAGPVVRPYTVTGGRARSAVEHLDMLAFIEARYSPDDADLVAFQPEHRDIIRIARTAISVAELAARLDLPLGVVRVLIGDLLHADLVATYDAGPLTQPPTEEVLRAVIDGLRAL